MVAAVVVLLGGGAAVYFLFFSAPKTDETHSQQCPRPSSSTCRP